MKSGRVVIAILLKYQSWNKGVPTFAKALFYSKIVRSEKVSSESMLNFSISGFLIQVPKHVSDAVGG